MKHIHLLLISSFIIAALCACSKEDTIDSYEDLRVPGNVAPPYHGITTLKVSNYVNKLFIDLIGEEPTKTQLDLYVDQLENNKLSDASRELVIKDIMTLSKYHEHLFDVISATMLNGTRRSEVIDAKIQNEAVRDAFLQNQDTTQAHIISYEIKKLEDLLSAQDDYSNDSISINDYYYRFAYNFVYDEINMGTQNFVISCFENMFNRYPTQSELRNSKKMVDSEASIVLLKEGSSKSDFIEIITKDDEFYFGLVASLYQSYLVREPSPQEHTAQASMLVALSDYQALQISLLKTDEYAGF